MLMRHVNGVLPRTGLEVRQRSGAHPLTDVKLGLMFDEVARGVPILEKAIRIQVLTLFDRVLCT